MRNQQKWTQLWKLTKSLQQCRECYSRKTAESQEEQQALWHFKWPYFRSLPPAFQVFSLYCRHPLPAVTARLAATEGVRTELGFLDVKTTVCHQTRVVFHYYFFKYFSGPLSLSPGGTSGTSSSPQSTSPSPRL